MRKMKIEKGDIGRGAFGMEIEGSLVKSLNIRK